MGKLCTSCGRPLSDGAKFCTGCGADASKEVHQVPAYQMSGELALPVEFNPSVGNFSEEGLLALLKGGFVGLLRNLKETLKDKKRLAIVIGLVLIWLIVNLLVAFDIFPLPVRMLSLLSSARGSLIGGSIGKGLFAAFLVQVTSGSKFLGGLKGGLKQVGGQIKNIKQSTAPLLLGTGAGLIAANLMGSSSLDNIMVSIAAFTLSAKALSGNGFLRRFTSALLQKTGNTYLTALMSGWTVGFALFMVVSLLPGRFNGYLVGVASLIVGVVFLFLNKSKKEADK